MLETVGIMPRSTTTLRPSPLSSEAAVDVRSRAKGVAPALLWAGLFLLAWLAMTLIFTVNISLHRTAYNSDLIHPYLLLQDLLADPTAILSWQLSPAIYVFPDWPLAALLVGSPLPNVALPLVYGGFLLASYGFLIGWLLVAMRTARWPEAVLWGCLLIAGLLMASNSSPIGLGGTYLSFIATPYIHSGAVLSGMLLIPLLIEVFHGRAVGQRRAIWLASVLVPLACYSDLVFVAWFAAPVCVALLIEPTEMPRWEKLRFITGLATASLLAVAADQLRPSRLSAVLDHNLWTGVVVWRDLLRQSVAGGQWQIWLPLGITLLMTVRGAWLLIQSRSSAPSRRRSIEIALIFATLSSLVLPFLAGSMIHESKLRYFLPVLFLPWVWLLLLASRLNTPERRPGLQAAGVALAVGCLPLLPKVSQAVARIEVTQKLRKTLEAEGLRAGYGDYWTAKPVMFETDRRVHCIPLFRAGTLDDRNYNGRWFTQRADGGGAIEPTFVVTSRLDQAKLRELFGEPARIVKFKKDQFVWIYDEPLPLIRQRP